MRILGLIIALLILLIPGTALAAKQPNLNLTSEQINSLQHIRCGWETTNQLLSEDLILNAQAVKIKASYTSKLKAIIPELNISQTDFSELIKYQNNANNFGNNLTGLFFLLTL